MAKAKKAVVTMAGKTARAGSRFKKLVIRPLTDKDWPAISSLFGDKGACGGCWCMYWRVERGGRTWDDMRGEKARTHFQRLVRSGKVHGLLAESFRRRGCRGIPRRNLGWQSTPRSLCLDRHSEDVCKCWLCESRRRPSGTAGLG